MVDRNKSPLSIVRRHKTVLAAAKAASTATVMPRAKAPEPKFRTVLAPGANWPGMAPRIDMLLTGGKK
ncbi:hypothetical protein [Paraburkholderia sp. C35]|uniref:hypothetical protein n=1 Tax=Paraburkholderia sp. C35 TaxID=2126993 RepID=UPI000D696CA8|nr:hypothetical protein [Paraburkholderia sp. C35]